MPARPDAPRLFDPVSSASAETAGEQEAAPPEAPRTKNGGNGSPAAASDSPPPERPAASPSREANVEPDAGHYEADSIQTLEGLEAVRKRPGMYIGGTGSEGLMHLVWELIDNGVDEAAAGHARRIDVTLGGDGSVTVRDDGRGIPVGRPPGRDVSAVEVVFSELHAGGKFGNGTNGSAYGASGGLHGVGASVVNALSERMRVEVGRDGHVWRLDFSERQAGHRDGDGFTPGHDLQRLKPTRRTFTQVRFWPDWELFDSDASFDYAATCERVRLMCHLVPGLRVTVNDRRRGAAGEPFDFRSEKGLGGLVAELATGGAVTRIIDVSAPAVSRRRCPWTARSPPSSGSARCRWRCSGPTATPATSPAS